MTDKQTAIRLAIYYRALATASFLAGVAIALVGLWLGLADAVAVVLGSFLESDVTTRALAAANFPVTGVLVGFGVIVWQVGKAAAFYWTFTTAIEHGPSVGAGGPDTQESPAGEATPTE